MGSGKLDQMRREARVTGINRRTFLGAATGAILGAEGFALEADAKPQAAEKRDETKLAGPPEGIDYFTQERLARAIDLSVPIDGIDFQAVCYTFNPWHPSPWMEQRFGKGWTEYETMRSARPQFAGHLQPKRPLWGCFNEADPAWAAREIELASSAGIDAFMIDWYWHEGTMFYHEQLEQGFLKAPNREKMKFAVMWANHDWPNCYPAPEDGSEAIILPQTYSDGDFDRMTDYLIEHYFRAPNYWRLDGKPVFGIFHTQHLRSKMGGSEKLRAIFDRMRDRCAKAGLGGLHLQASHAFEKGNEVETDGYDSATQYHTFAGGPGGKQSSFARGAETAIARWNHQAASFTRIPYFPECPVGWDNSPRYGKNAHVFVNRTADQFERLLVAAKHFLAARKTNPPVVFMGAWNEWTEDHYLLPDEVHGYSYLEAVKRQFAHE
jgi:hypothetical protein